MPYEEDFYAWTVDQAARLRARAHNGIDWENAAEEIESLGKSDRRELHSRLRVLLHHLLKWKFQSIKRKSGWRRTIREQRRQVLLLLRDSPSLRSTLRSVTEEEYPHAVEEAVDETRIPTSAFPKACPFTVEDILDPDFYPEAAA
ncbi:DUF29 domain-containing protein [Aureimonas leprariae]|uniref:DUF29 domain-containing protein n=1 Tax=Plantimonas leprariae TaxID=2615207 RepID=UPI001FE69F48|nr:DUF29 domain-containing protein [Aureimonas leprariae]